MNSVLQPIYFDTQAHNQPFADALPITEMCNSGVLLFQLIFRRLVLPAYILARGCMARAWQTAMLKLAYRNEIPMIARAT